MNQPPDPDEAAIERALHASRVLEDAPEQVIRRAIAAWQGAPVARLDTAPGLLQRIVATLSFDSGAASPLAFGARSGGSTKRQLLFSAEGQDIDLRIQPDSVPGGGRWVLSGQVLGAQAAGGVALLDERGALLGEAPLNELGEFRLPPVPAGRCALRLNLAGREIDLPVIDVPQAR